ncbi:MAG: class I SAM-dependent methyltransferase [Tabrizicola sp.]|nr:class I SAM-dependent methyltransferase [Tabrizicola sp.]
MAGGKTRLAGPITASDWAKLDARQAFSHIYRHRLWGGTGFYSGAGSHDPGIVTPYVDAIRTWAMGQGPLDAVDLGCGDFHVGAAVRPLFRDYVACDVVPDLIAHHQTGPHAGNVDFRCLDLARDPLPAGDVVFIRQVLQHLPNAMVQDLIPRLYAYRWLVLTEHLPSTPGFTLNLDKPIGPGIRLKIGSGIDLTAEPFLLRALEERVMCEVPQFGGLVRTTLYRLRP